MFISGIHVSYPKFDAVWDVSETERSSAREAAPQRCCVPTFDSASMDCG
jgi:hypothetical protein